jgi:hypothetical protein
MPAFLVEFVVAHFIGHSSYFCEVKRYFQSQSGIHEYEFTDFKKVYTNDLSLINPHKLDGNIYVLRKIMISARATWLHLHNPAVTRLAEM